MSLLVRREQGTNCGIKPVLLRLDLGETGHIERSHQFSMSLAVLRCKRLDLASLFIGEIETASKPLKHSLLVPKPGPQHEFVSITSF